jgi:hypothetical protein
LDVVEEKSLLLAVWYDGESTQHGGQVRVVHVTLIQRLSGIELGKEIAVWLD